MELSETTLVENTILIAKFMGYEVIPYQGNEFKPIYNGNPHARTIGEQKSLWGGLDLQFTGRFVEYVKYPFNTDFNYLLPVIRKIEEQGFVVCVAGIRYQVYKVMDEGNPIVSLVCGDVSKKTEMVYALVVSFIEYIVESELKHKDMKLQIDFAKEAESIKQASDRAFRFIKESVLSSSDLPFDQREIQLAEPVGIYTHVCLRWWPSEATGELRPYLKNRFNDSEESVWSRDTLKIVEIADQIQKAIGETHSVVENQFKIHILFGELANCKYMDYLGDGMEQAEALAAATENGEGFHKLFEFETKKDLDTFMFILANGGDGDYSEIS